MPDENQEKISNLAEKIINLSRNTLTVNMRFLSVALSRLIHVDVSKKKTQDEKNQEKKEITIATDGKFLFYEPKYILLKYKEEKEKIARTYFHIILHCVFRHMFAKNMNQDYWDLSCDIAVENIITELDIKAVCSKKEQFQRQFISFLKNEGLKQLTAERIYKYFSEHPLKDDALQKMKEIFQSDDHFLWYLSAEELEKLRIQHGLAKKSFQEGEQKIYINGNLITMAEVETDWQKISEIMAQDLETFSKKHGDKSGNFIFNIKEVNREKYDYESFLKKFAVMGEVMRMNPDEFDYVFYTYGLQLYQKVPLIEPLEYREEKRIKDFVIAIDTSGSTVFHEVQHFVQKTYNILKSTENFFDKVNIHIIQCDADIQQDYKITSQNEFDYYMKNMKILGGGGTDFRPVFDHVNELIKNKEFTDLRGLIYFTDGYGVYPQKMPEYKTAFVFIKTEYQIPDVPPWAIKLVLEEGDI